MKDFDLAECKRLLGAAVAAKLRFWDELRQIEVQLAGGEFADKANDKVIDLIDLLAAGIDDADSAEQMMEDEHVTELLKAIGS